MSETRRTITSSAIFSKVFPFFLAIGLALFMAPLQAFSEEDIAIEQVEGINTNAQSITNLAEAQPWDIGENCIASLDSGVLTIEASGYPAIMRDYQSKSAWPWDAQRSEVTRIVFKNTVAVYGNLVSMFDSMDHLTRVDGLQNFDTSNCISMASMFAHCTALTTLSLRGLDTSSVGNTANMFRGCTALTFLDLSDFNASVVRSMQQMFDSCNALETIKFPTFFDISLVQDMDSTFAHCWVLKDLDLSGFKTNRLQQLDNTFYECRSLTLLDLSTFVAPSTTSMQNLFYGCSSLVQLTLGDDFAFGIGENPYPPSPSGTTKPGFYTGKWVNTSGNVFLNSEIPSFEADTYYAQVLPVSLKIEGYPLYVGATLDAVLTNSQGKDFSYRWERGISTTGPFTDIPGATTSQYVLTDDDLGRYFRCTATFENIVVSDMVGPTAIIVDPSQPTTSDTTTANGGSTLAKTGDFVGIATVAYLCAAAFVALILLLIRRKQIG